MLPVPFSFSGRLARWPYFKACLGLALSCLLPVFLLVAFHGPMLAGNRAAVVGLVVLLGLFAIAVIWISLALQARRCRDIGWNPAFVIPAWIGLQVVDAFLARVVPTIAAGRHGEETYIGVVVNLAMVLALSFWPSADDEPSPAVPSASPRTRTEALRNTAPAAPVTPRIAPGPVSFGRR